VTRHFEVQLTAAPASARVVDAAETAARAAAEERGRAAGHAAGEARALAGAVQRLDEAVAEFQRAREAADRAVAADAANLAVSIARELLRVEITAGRYDLERIVRESLQASGAGRAECVVHLHPRDLQKLEGVAFRSATRLEGDPDVALGDVHVSTARGTIVRDVDAALSAVTERLREDLA
jgi:flagellar biosynthesis/type III secretory pathway protein FliH